MKENSVLHDLHSPTHDLPVAHFVIFCITALFGIINILAQKPAHARIYDQWPERVYDEEFAKYFSQDSFYVQLTPSTSEKALQELKANGIILSYAQPFTTLDIPYYRLQFKTSNQEKIQTILNIMKKNNHCT